MEGSDIEDEDAISYTIVENPSEGSLSLTNDIAVYTPSVDYNGLDYFTYKTVDSLLVIVMI